MSGPLRFVFGVHLHQPVGNFDYVFSQHVRDVYRPFLERTMAAGFGPLTVHASGPLLDWLEAHEPAFLDEIGALAADGRIELLLAGFDEPILASLPAGRPGPRRADPAHARGFSGGASGSTPPASGSPSGCGSRSWPPTSPMPAWATPFSTTGTSW